jgi:succinate-semialdehyde dehydrogenase/glutarate-semialdehyde dehydrogenase
MEHQCHVIDGVAVVSTDPQTLPVVSPWTEEVIARIPVGSAEDVDAAVRSAVAAQRDWSLRGLDERIDLLAGVADTVERHLAELAQIESDEMGKPVPLAEQFIESGIAGWRQGLDLARSYPFVADVTVPGEPGQTVVERRPVGVVGLIIPWNFTVASILGSLLPLLAAGNTVVLKPSEKSPLSAARFVEMLDLPPGVVNLVLGDARAGRPLAAHDDVALLHFTGSVEVGRAVGVAAASRLKRSVLELGGNDPVIVDADVDVVATAEAVAMSSFVNSGQICTSSERIYVHRDIAEDFIAALVAAAGSYELTADREGTGLGPLVDARQRAHVHAHVAEAVEHGATVLRGGALPDGPGFGYPATVLTGVTAEMRVMREETFGPVAPVVVVDSFDEAVELANGTGFGLAATVYTHDPVHQQRAGDIHAAVIWINGWQQGGVNAIAEPWGLSGVGAAGSVADFDAATRPVSLLRAATA